MHHGVLVRQLDFRLTLCTGAGCLLRLDAHRQVGGGPEGEWVLDRRVTCVLRLTPCCCCCRYCDGRICCVNCVLLLGIRYVHFRVCRGVNHRTLRHSEAMPNEARTRVRARAQVRAPASLTSGGSSAQMLNLNGSLGGDPEVGFGCYAEARAHTPRPALHSDDSLPIS